MKIFGFQIGKSPTQQVVEEQKGQVLDARGGFFDFIRESFTGAWQRNVEIKRESVLSYSAVFACMSLISADIGKLRPSVRKKVGQIYEEVASHPYLKLLKKPNKYQTWQKFVENWVISKLSHGNAYVLKVRDSRNNVVELHVLNPHLVRVLVATNGEVFYSLSQDPLAGITSENSIDVPASEIIHDTMICLYHPLVGVSPIYACGLAAMQGITIQNNSTTFFNNMSRPSGMLTAPNKISDTTADRLKKAWEENFSGGKIGKLAVLGDGLTYEAMTISAADSQMLEQLKWTAETVCSCFHVPAYKVGIGQLPTYNSAEVLNQIYYTDCLQALIESMESMLEDGLGLDELGFDLELELDGLLRMDTATQIETLNKGVSGGWLAPNEARAKRNLKPVKGGDTPYMQQQNYALAALAERDSKSPLSGKKPDEMNSEDPDLEDEDLEENPSVAEEASKLMQELMTGLTKDFVQAKKELENEQI